MSTSGASTWDRIAVLSLGAAFVATALVYSRLPDPLPTHFDLAGNANGWMPRPFGAWGIPTFAVALWALTRFFMKLLPGAEKKRLTTESVAIVAMMTGVFISAIHVLVLYVALVPGVIVTKPIFALMGFFFVGLGLVLPRVRRNPIIGVRTAWTLTSDENWARTHRFAGYAMVLGGIVGGTAGSLGGVAGSGVAIAAFVLSGLVPAVYSFVIARREDPG